MTPIYIRHASMSRLSVLSAMVRSSFLSARIRRQRIRRQKEMSLVIIIIELRKLTGYHINRNLHLTLLEPYTRLGYTRHTHASDPRTNDPCHRCYHCHYPCSPESRLHFREPPVTWNPLLLLRESLHESIDLPGQPTAHEPTRVYVVHRMVDR